MLEPPVARAGAWRVFADGSHAHATCTDASETDCNRRHFHSEADYDEPQSLDHEMEK